MRPCAEQFNPAIFLACRRWHQAEKAGVWTLGKLEHGWIGAYVELEDLLEPVEL